MNDLVTQVNQWFGDSLEHERDWRRRAREDFEFYLGEQWDETSKHKLQEDGRPVLTINKIKPVVKLLSGYERQSRMDIKCLPMEGSDGRVADVLTALIKFIMGNNNGEYEQSFQFQDGLVCGKGFSYVNMDFSEDFLNGEIRVKSVRPFNVFVDPLSVEYDLSDAAYVMRVLRIRRNGLKRLYPEMAETIDRVVPKERPELLYPQREAGNEYDPVDGSSYHPGGEQALVVKECWYRTHREQNLLGDRESGEIYPTSIPETQIKQLLESSGRFFMVKRILTGINLAVVCGDLLLEDKDSPFSFSAYPVMPFYAEYTPSAPSCELRFQGLVHALKDPQREINKRRAQLLHIINTAANSGWIMEHGALRDKRILERFGSKPGVVIEVEPGRRLERITPAPTPRGYIDLEAISTENIKEISAINADLLGHYEKTTPGIAIQLRQRQGIIAVQEIFDNFRYTKRLLGKFLIRAIQDYYTPEKVLRIIGPQMGLRDSLDQQEVMVSLQNADLSKYDIAVDEAVNAPTHRTANFQTLLELVRMGLPIPPELIIEASDLPNKKEIISRLKEPPRFPQWQAQNLI